MRLTGLIGIVVLALSGCSDDGVPADSTSGGTSTASATANTDSADSQSGSQTATASGSAGETEGSTEPPNEDSSSSGGSSGGPDGSSGTDTGGTDTGTDTGGTDTGGTTTGGDEGLIECTMGGDRCPVSMECFPSSACAGDGFCVSTTIDTCGGFIGTVCPVGLDCISDPLIADGFGVCIDPDLTELVCGAQAACWFGCAAD